MKQKTYDVIVVGGGAAGLMAAIHAASGGAHTAILDHHEVSGKMQSYPLQKTVLIYAIQRQGYRIDNSSPPASDS